MVYDPEEVVLASGMDANPILGFLQENYLDFIREDAIEDLASASDYLSSAGKTLSKTILTKYWHSDEVLPLMDVESKEKWAKTFPGSYSLVFTVKKIHVLNVRELHQSNNFCAFMCILLDWGGNTYKPIQIKIRKNVYEAN